MMDKLGLTYVGQAMANRLKVREDVTQVLRGRMGGKMYFIVSIRGGGDVKATVDLDHADSGTTYEYIVRKIEEGKKRPGAE